jgi:hypothetical protein
MNSDTSANRIIVIRTSLRVFVCGLIGWLPLIGYFPALYALVAYFRIRARYRDEWNPASTYLAWGAGLALTGFLISVLLVAALLVVYVLH